MYHSNSNKNRVQQLFKYKRCNFVKRYMRIVFFIFITFFIFNKSHCQTSTKNVVVDDVDYYIENQNIVFVFTLVSNDYQPFFDLNFQFENEDSSEVIRAVSIQGDVDCIKADENYLNAKVRKVQWNVINDGVALSGNYRLVCSASPSNNFKIQEKLKDEKKRIENELKLQKIRDDRAKFLKEREKTIYNYKQIMPLTVSQNNDILEKTISSFIIDKESGYFDLEIRYKFDTSGNNLGYIKASGQDGSMFNNYLNNYRSSLNFIPGKENNMLVACESNLNYSINWSINRSRYKSTSTRLKKVGGGPINFNEQQLLKDAPIGIYTLSNKTIKCNGVNFTENKIENYKCGRGPLNVIYSLILPGIGTKRVTYNEKGNGTLILFLLSTGISAVSKYYSNLYFDKYLTSTNQSDIQNNYKISNNLQKSFLVSGGFSCTIYVYDFFHVLVRGIRNKQDEHYNLLKVINKSPIKSTSFQLPD